MYFSVSNIHKTFPLTPAASKNGTAQKEPIIFSTECEKGTMTCILGPSGSGKSTVLNIIAGLEKNDTEYPLEISLDGKRIEGLPPAKREIGMVFQSGALFNHLTVVQNVAYGLISNGMKKKVALEKASSYLRNFELEGFDNRMPQTLSGGERQRVALARTLIIEPKLVLLDEPFSALDTELRHKLASALKQWQKSLGFTSIMVTHDEMEAQAVGDRVINFKSCWGQGY